MRAEFFYEQFFVKWREKKARAFPQHTSKTHHDAAAAARCGCFSFSERISERFAKEEERKERNDDDGESRAGVCCYHHHHHHFFFFFFFFSFSLSLVRVKVRYT